MRVLVVEDYPPIRKAVAKSLRESGFAVDEAGDGDEGLWFATNNEYDVVVLDLMLPGLDGLSLLAQLRRDGRAVHVLVVTAKDTIEDRVRGLDLGADDYLVKPFAMEELMARVRALARRAYVAKNPLIEIGDLSIDTVARRVSRGGIDVALTPREFALLEYLALRAGEVVTRMDVWEHLYDFSADSDSNVVDVYIGYLRRKLDRPGLASLIQTVRGSGYTLRTTS
jgi:DNA-binding response OmpR family regulator